MDPGLFGLTLWSVLISMLVLPVAVAAIFLSLRIADRIGGIRWSRLRNKIEGDAHAAAIYAAARWIALAILLAAILR